jgi:hypothetical protein
LQEREVPRGARMLVFGDVGISVSTGMKVW